MQMMSLMKSVITKLLKWIEVKVKVMSDSLWPHGLYSPWNSPGQNTGVGSLSLLQGIFPTQGSNPSLLHCRWILYQRSYQESPGPQRSLRELEVLAAYTVRGTPPLTQASSVGGPSPEPHCRPGSLALSALVHLVLYCLFPSCLLGVSSDSSSFCIFQLLSFFVISFGCSDTIW